MTVSVLTWGRAGDEVALERTLGSLGAQRAAGWELCAAVGPGFVSARLAARMRVVELPRESGAAAAYHAALARATGEHIMLLAPGDELAPAALARLSRELDRRPEVDVVYADEDRAGASGAHHGAFRRPDWSPDYLLSAFYVERAFLVRRSAVDAAGGVRPGFDPVPEWDLLLRLGETGRPFAHVREVLFHRPGEPGDAWRPADGALIDAGRRVVANACRRRGLTAEVLPLALPGTYRVRRAVAAGTSVSLVVPFRDGAVLLERCVRSVLTHCGHIPIEVLLVDNGSVEDATLSLLRGLGADARVRVTPAPGPFNYAALVNRGAAAARHEVLCLLNSDVEALGAGWLEALVEQAERPDVGAVGAKLLYPDRSIQHAGVVLGGGDISAHAHRFAPGATTGPFGDAAVVREVSAVTGACLATRRAVFEQMGGLAESLPVAYNDIDFCLRTREAGFRVLYTPHAELLHHEGASRGRGEAETAAVAYMRRRWGACFERDPYRIDEDDGRAPAATGLGRQLRRARWLAQDIATAVRAWRHAADRGEGGPGIALLAGGPVAVAGRSNRYWIRLHNLAATPAEVRLEVAGRFHVVGREQVFRLATARVLAPRSAVDLTCETDWRDRFDLREASPLVGCRLDGQGSGTCELSATLVSRAGVATMRIEQAARP